jgi:hypothetical protein
MRRSNRPFGAFWVAAVLALSTLASAQQPPPTTPPPTKQEKREDRKEKREERREDRKEQRDENKEKREEQRDENKEKRDENKEKREEQREERKDRRQEQRETRKARRQDRVKEIRDRWGDLLRHPHVQAELKVHAWRMARLNQIKTLGEAEGKTDLVTRTDKLIEREKARHQAAMEGFKSKGGAP